MGSVASGLMSSNPIRVATINVHGAKDLLNKEPRYRYLDVRTEEEFSKGHVENAVNIPYMFFTSLGPKKNPNFRDQVLAVFNKEDPVVVGCQAGSRSAKAAADLVEAEFKNVMDMEGGYNAWVNEGFPVKS